MSATCPHCNAPIQIETATFTEFRCGAGFYSESGDHWECDESTRAQRIEDNDGWKNDAERMDRKGVTA